jgi:hypothetical protein
MKSSVLFSLILVTGCILAAGCLTEPEVAPITGNVSPTPAPAITPSVTMTTVPTPAGTDYKGKLTVSIGGWYGEFPVSVDTMDVGVVATDKPLILMLEEGNHTVELCCNMRCEQETVDIRFGKQRFIDFSEQLKRDLKYAVPTAEIVSYRPFRDHITIDVEFINPTPKPLTMSADISCGYSYVENTNFNRIRNVAEGQVTATVNGCDRTTQTLRFSLGSGYNYVYDNAPTITNIRSE